MRICILSKDNEPLGFLDNEISEGLHFYDDTLHIYFTGTAHTFEFAVIATEEAADLLKVGNKISFVYKDRGYYMSIMNTEQDEEEIKVEAWSYCLELLNEKASSYEPAEAHTFLEYFTTMIFTNDIFEVGVNEVSTYKRKVEFSNDTDTLLARIYSLATNFDAEVEFIPQLNADYSLDKFLMNVFKEHSDTDQGIGERREDEYFRYGKDVDGVTKTQDISELYTMIVPTGKDGLTIASLGERKVYDDDGNLLYWHPDKSAAMYAPVACQNFPSAVTSKDKYIRYDWDTEYSSVETLYGNALAKLKKISAPESTYEIEGNIDVNVGDTITVIDEAFSPPLYLETRVTEQEISFTDPTKGKATFSNTKELETAIDSTLLKRMEEIKKTAEDAATAANTAQTTAITAQETATAAQSTAETANTTASEAKTTAEAANTTAESANTTALSAQSTAESAQSTANTANSTANTAKTTAETANTNANEAKETANTANETATAAQSTANTANETANAASTAASNAQTTADNAQSTAETANTAASEAKTTAEAANTTAESANTTALSAQSTAETAQNTANTANSTANTAKSTADSASETANTANSTANTAKEAADSASTTANTANSTANTAKTTAEAANTNANEAKETANTANTTASAAQSTANAASTAASNAQSTAETAQTTANTAKAATDTLNTLIRETTDGVEVAKIDSAGAYTGMRTEQTSDAYLIKDKDGNELASYGADTVELGKGNETAVINMCDGATEITARRVTPSSEDTGSSPYVESSILFPSGYGKIGSDLFNVDTGELAYIDFASTDLQAYVWIGSRIENDAGAGYGQISVTASPGNSIVSLGGKRLALWTGSAQELETMFYMSDVIKALNNGLQLSTKSFQHTFGVNSGTTYGTGSWTNFTTTNINVPADKLASDDDFLVTLSVGINGKADGAATVRWWEPTRNAEYAPQTTRQTIPLKSGITSTFNVTFNWWPGHTPVAFLGWPQVYATAQWSPSFAKVSISRFANNFQSA